MKTITNILILVLSLTLISGCMPASFTKWKQNAPTTKQPTSVFTDDSGNSVSSGTIKFPSYITYHPSLSQTVYYVSTASTASYTYSPSMDGDLASGYPFSSSGQALDPSFSLESLAVPYNCGGTLLLYPGSTSDLSISSSSGGITLQPGVLTTPAPKEYCVKLSYKTPIAAKPGYTYSYLYGVLKLQALTPLSTLDFQHSSHIVIELSSVLNLDQFVKGRTLTASPSGATATIEYLDTPTSDEEGIAPRIFATVSSPSTATSAFRAGDVLSVSPGGVLSGYDGMVSRVYNIFPNASSLSIPNITTRPLASAADLAANGVSFTLLSPTASPFLTIGATTGSLSAVIQNSNLTIQDYYIRVQNGLGNITYNYKAYVANAYYPSAGNGNLLYPQSGTISVKAINLEGDTADYVLGGTVNTPYGGTANIVAATPDSLDSDILYLTLAITATGTLGFQDDMEILAGSSTMTMSQVTDIFPTASSANILGRGSVPMLPYWSLGNTDSNPRTYTITTLSSPPSSIRTTASSGLIYGYSRNAVSVSYSIASANHFDRASNQTSYTKRMSFASSTDPSPVGLSYGLTSTASCNSKVRIAYYNTNGSTPSSYYTVGGSIRSLDGAVGTVTYIDNTSNYIYATMNVASAIFKTGDKITSTPSGAFIEKGTVNDVTYILERNKNVNTGTCAGQLVVNLTPANLTGLTYTVSPDLPTGMSLNSSTGAIAGTPTALSNVTRYTITVTNAAGATSGTLNFKVSEAPEGLSYTHQALLELEGASSAFFKKGTPISSNSLVLPGTGVVRDVFTCTSGNLCILVDVKNGYFEAGSNVDVHANYKDPYGVVKTTKNNSLTLLVNKYGSPTALSVGSYIYAKPAGLEALGVINEIQTVGTRYKVYIRLLSGTFKVAGSYSQVTPQAYGQTFGVAAAGSVISSLSTVSASDYWFAEGINAPVVQATTLVSKTTDFSVGSNLIVTATAGTASASLASAYLGFGPVSLMALDNSAVTTTPRFLTLSYEDLVVPADNATPAYIVSQTYNSTTVSNKARFLALPTVGTPNAFNHSDTFVVYQGDEVVIAPELVAGQEIAYSISPTLPPLSGLTFSTSTGAISGTVKDSIPLTNYTVTASNALGTTTRTFSLESVRHFEVSVNMADAPSLYIHKAGVGNRTTPCRVTWDQSLNTDDSNYHRDTTCIVEAGEMDLYLRGLNFNLFSGKDMCDQFTYEPYFFYAFRPANTNTTAKSVNCGCTASELNANNVGLRSCEDYGYISGNNFYDSTNHVINSPVDLCVKIVKSDTDELKCDKGKVAVTTYQYKDSTTTGACTIRPDAASCLTAEACADAAYDCDGLPATATGTAGTWIWDCIADSSFSSSTSNTSCGGDPFNCLGGTYEDAELTSADLKNGVAGKNYENVISGLKMEIKIKSPSVSGFSSNMKVANFTASNSCSTADEYNYFAGGWEKYASDSAFGANPWAQGNPFYVFSCLDSSGEIKGRMRVIVREWNGMFALTDYLDKLIGNIGNQENGGLNNRYDWDDAWTGFWDGYATVNAPGTFGACGPAAAPAGGTYAFPGETY